MRKQAETVDIAGAESLRQAAAQATRALESEANEAAGREPAQVEAEQVENMRLEKDFAALKAAAAIQFVKLDAIEAMEQPRKHFDEESIDAMAETMKVHGVIEPPILRKNGDTYQIIVGERRCRAARRAGLKEVRVLVVSCTDDQAFDIQMVENLHREDLTAVDEALAYERMNRPVTDGGLGRSVDEIAERVGKSRTWVFSRLKLTELCSEGRKALERGQVTPSVAELVARIPGHGQQAVAVKEFVDRWEKSQPKEADRVPVPFSEARAVVHGKYLLPLGQAPFDLKDDTLSPEAGPCTTCPHNSNNQTGDLFSLKSKPHCLKSSCYDDKVAEHWKAIAEKQKANGYKVLSLNQGQKLFQGDGLPHDSEYVELAAVCHDDAKKRTWGQLVGENLDVTHVVAPDSHAKPRVLLRREDAVKALKDSGHKLGKVIQDRAAKEKAATSKEDRAEANREKVARESFEVAIREAVVAAAKGGDIGVVSWRLIVTRLILDSGMWADIAERHGWQGGIQGVEDQVGKLKERDLQALAMEIAIDDELAGIDLSEPMSGATLGLLSKELKLDHRAIAKHAQQLTSEATDPKKKAEADAEKLFEKKGKGKK